MAGDIDLTQGEPIVTWQIAAVTLTGCPCILAGLYLAWLGVSGEALKGHLDMLLLSVLGQGPAHGYALIESLAQRSDGKFSLPEGTVYPALHRLEFDGLLASRWAQQDGRRRRIYSLTGKGRRRLQVRRQEWQTFSGAVGAVLENGG